jgi:DNA-binding CsgD family transcriptional regulator
VDYTSNYDSRWTANFIYFSATQLGQVSNILAYFYHNLVPSNQTGEPAVSLCNRRIRHLMDKIVDGAFRKSEQFERLVAELGDGLFVVNAKGEVLCVLQDVTAQQRWHNGVIAAVEAVIPDPSISGRLTVEKIAPTRRESDSDSLDQLTERERDVLSLICEGRDDSEMSKLLMLSPNTVRNHIAALYRKIGVNRRAAAIIWAQERGIAGCGLLKPKSRRPGKNRGTSSY